MKKTVIILVVFLVAQTANAQLFGKERILNRENIDKKTLSWGYYLGFNVGLLGNLRISNYFDLRLEPGLSFTKRNIVFPGFSDPKDNLREVKATYIHIPLLLKVSTKRLNNIKPFLIGGFSTSFNLSSNENNPEDNETGRFRSTTNNYNYELGFGIDIYLYYFKFTPSIRGIFGLNDQLVRDIDPNSGWTRNIEKMTSRGVFINFTIQ